MLLDVGKASWTALRSRRLCWSTLHSIISACIRLRSDNAAWLLRLHVSFEAGRYESSKAITLFTRPVHLSWSVTVTVDFLGRLAYCCFMCYLLLPSGRLSAMSLTRAVLPTTVPSSVSYACIYTIVRHSDRTVRETHSVTVHVLTPYVIHDVRCRFLDLRSWH